MIGICGTMLVTGLCVALATGAARAEDSPFVENGGGGGHGR